MLLRCFGLDKVFNKSVEIFPKQNTLAGGKKGSCINLPYFAAEKTKQFVIDRELKKVDFATALTIFDKAQSYSGCFYRHSGTHLSTVMLHVVSRQSFCLKLLEKIQGGTIFFTRYLYI